MRLYASNSSHDMNVFRYECFNDPLKGCALQTIQIHVAPLGIDSPNRHEAGLNNYSSYL